MNNRIQSYSVANEGFLNRLREWNKKEPYLIIILLLLACTAIFRFEMRIEYWITLLIIISLVITKAIRRNWYVIKELEINSEFLTLVILTGNKVSDYKLKQHEFSIDLKMKMVGELSKEYILENSSDKVPRIQIYKHQLSYSDMISIYEQCKLNQNKSLHYTEKNRIKEVKKLIKT